MNCHPTHCGLRVRLEGQRVLETLGDPEHPESRGFACVRGQAVADVVDNPERVLVPRVRSGPDGFVDTTWEEALEQIARAIEQVGAARSAVYTGHGVRGQFAARFASMLGTQWWDPSIVCWGLGGLGFRLTGVTEVNTAEDMAAHAELIVLWGASIASQPTTAPRIVTAKARGARVLLIDVRQGESAGLADETYLVRPGSDAALALALLHVIVREKLYSESFVREHTVGFDELCAHVAAFSPAWAARETGLSVERIEGLARTKIELLSERAHELGLQRLPVQPPEGENTPSSRAPARFPLVLVQGRSLTHFHSFYDHGRVLPLLHATEPEPVLWLNPSDALARGIASGDDVDIFNERGRMAAKARVTEKVQAGVVWMHSGWRGVNQLTSSVRQVPLAVARAFSSAGAASYEARVDVTLSS